MGKQGEAASHVRMIGDGVSGSDGKLALGYFARAQFQ